MIREGSFKAAFDLNDATKDLAWGIVFGKIARGFDDMFPGTPWKKIWDAMWNGLSGRGRLAAAALRELATNRELWVQYGYRTVADALLLKVKVGLEWAFGSQDP